MEEGNEKEELDVTPTVDNDDTPGGTGSGADDDSPAGRGTSSDRSDRSSRSSGGNRWSRVRDGMGESLRKGIKGDETDHQSEEEDEDLEDDLDDDEDLDDREDDRGARGTGDEDEDPDDDDEPGREERKGEKGKGAGEDDDEEPGDETARYEVVDADTGDKFKVDLPKGATIRFAGDGKVIEAKSFDDVIKLAQKGAAFDRVSSTAGQENARLRTAVKELEASQTADEDLLLKLVFGELEDEELETLQKELKPYQDPKAREGLKALLEKEERTKSDKADGERAAQAAATEFWTQTRGVIATDLSRFEFLDADDSGEIESKFYGAYTAELDRLLPEYERQAAAQSLTKEDALAAADRDARKLLTEKTLRRVMKDLNAKYEKRSTKGRPKGEKSGRREVEQHNKRVVDKREQRRDPARRSLRTGGAAPRDRDPGRKGKEPVGFDAKLQRGLSRLRAAGRSGSGED